MKVFQIINNICQWQTPYSSLAQTAGKYPSDVVFVEAPDYVFEGWGYQDGNFIRPEPPEGWLYDELTGTFYREGETPLSEKNKAEQFYSVFAELVSGRYTLQEQLRLLASEFYHIAVAARMSEALSADFTDYKDFLETCRREAHEQIYGGGGEQNAE